MRAVPPDVIHDRLAAGLHPSARPSFDELVRYALGHGLDAWDVWRWMTWAERRGLLEVAGAEGAGRPRLRVAPLA